jgi:hypothetical protein
MGSSGAMVTRSRLAVGALMAVLLAGCGSSSSNGTSSSATSATSSTASTASSASSAPSALGGVKGRVLTAGELAGFKPAGNRTLGVDAASWAASGGTPASRRSSETTRLTGLGFVAAISEHLQPTSGGAAEGLSIVEQFRSAGSARTELAYQVKQGTGPGVTTFAVPGIPGASGFGGSSSETTGMNVAFSKGAYYYLVGAGWPTGTSSTPTRAELIAAAQHLYNRVTA